jgi:hypothetical protein
VETSIDEEISTLRDQVAATAEEIRRRRALAGPGTPNDASSAELDELVEAHASMMTRLSRLLSCKRTPS